MAHRPAPLASVAAIAGLIASPSLASAQDYTQYEVQFMIPKTDQIEELNEALAAHNQEYHSGGPYHANVWYVANGPRTGQLVWAMGPVTFAQLESRPSVGGHDDDWEGNVMPHLEAEMDVSYWRRNDGASFMPDDDLHPILRIRAFKIARGEMFRFLEQRRMVREVYEAKGYTRASWVVQPRFRPQTGPDVVVITPYDQWGDLDGGGFGQFQADFREIHGNGGWQRWVDTNQEIIEDSWDEYHQLIPELSGGEG